MKNWLKGNGRLIAGAFSQICAMGMAFVLAFLGYSMNVVNRQGSYYTLDPFSEEENFEQTSTFYDFLHVDLSQLSEYMAVSSQMEKDGKYDSDKEIDIFAYDNRKRTDKPTVELPKLIYKIGDLIAWWRSEEGFCYESYGSTESISDESMDTTEGDEETASYMIVAETADETAEGGYRTEANTAYTTDETEEAASDEAALQPDTAEQEETRLIEEYKPVNMDSLYDLTLPDGMTYANVEQAVQQAACDLATNYTVYNSYKQVLKDDMNLKYLMVDPSGKVQYTNLDRSKDTNALIAAMQECGVYMCYDYQTDELVCDGVKAGNEVPYKSLLHSYRYSFPEGGKLYICVRTQADKTANTKLLGKWNPDDAYAQAAKSYTMLKNKMPLMGFMMLLVIAGILALFALAGYIAFIIMQPKREKEQLRYFDTWYTELAAAIAIGSAFLVGWFGVEIAASLGDNGYNTYSGQIGAKVFCGILLLTFFLLYLMLLAYTGSLVRRIKAGTFWKNSICYRLLHGLKLVCKKCLHVIGRGIQSVLNHRSLAIRSFVPVYGGLLGLFLVNLFFAGVGVIGIAIFLDLIVIILYGLYIYYSNRTREKIVEGITRISEGDLTYQIDTEKIYGENKVMAEAVNQIGNAVQNAVTISMKDERLKADLITNVSHDIKTPLTSIINYVDLLKREDIQNEKAQEYIRILDEKSQRLKRLTLDLVEASKISSGNITLKMGQLNVSELFTQAIGEYEDKWKEKGLQIVADVEPKDGEAPYLIWADSDRTWRVLNNLFGNIYKYAMQGTRVYCDVNRIVKTVADQESEQSMIEITVKNISAQPLNIAADELTERFIRGDVSRSTEGSGLGLSIAKNLVKAQGGEFEIYLDGDLFKVSIDFPAYTDNMH
ncbi:HAMP domain-containing histidine kinase [Kineothrix sp. MSJ-39]|uniref:HAMP domain-containing sensor histidine kinase n=1 Tax=Kineothrix sp. MSJ-39 TaxID=2841533 RepID=UPI001C11411B|nr:HAMP domain-containing sensor histidine kinase [Kineothrix sp. MSJ-39]MBU5429243.1 HAMP domain-containing histidine kinase [Kineothrix sp. MSJ-39]